VFISTYDKDFVQIVQGIYAHEGNGSYRLYWVREYSLSDLQANVSSPHEIELSRDLQNALRTAGVVANAFETGVKKLLTIVALQSQWRENL
jgi:hypothetical protein